MLTLKYVVLGLLTYVPNLHALLARGTGGTNSARYCYSVWLRHLVMARDNGLTTRPKVVAELGPGDSLGIGLAALLSGAEKYFAFDIVRHADVAMNVAVLEELVGLFRAREPIPDNDEFASAEPRLECYDFPGDLLPDEVLENSLLPDRVDRLRRLLLTSDPAGRDIRYMAPWFDLTLIEEGTVDMIFSQAVLEHIDDLETTYRAMHRWLKPSGFLSHQIDFRCHGISRKWNGHWTIGDFTWKLMRGRLPYLLNRQPHTAHLRLLVAAGFKPICDRRVVALSGIERRALAPRFKDFTDEDLNTCGAFIQAVKVQQPEGLPAGASGH